LSALLLFMRELALDIREANPFLPFRCHSVPFL
jgi:hypothetical protein